MRRENLRLLFGFLAFGAAVFALSVTAPSPAPQCLPNVVERGGPTRHLPHAFFDQADESRRRMHPSSRVLESRRSSSIGDVDYALLVFERSSGDRVEIAALAVEHATSRVWDIEAECAPDAWRNGVDRTLIEIARLPTNDGGAQRAAMAFVPFDATTHRMVNGIAFGPDGGTMYVALLHHVVLARRGEPTVGAPETALYVALRTPDGWSDPVILPFSGQHDDYEPALTPDGSVMVFNSKRPYSDGRAPEVNDLWWVQQGADGWGSPRRIEAVSTLEHEESYGTLAADGTLIYLRGRPEADGSIQYDLFQTRLADGDWAAPTRHPVSTDRWGEGDPWIAPDGGYLIFTRWDESVGWSETVDLYIAFDGADGWSTPVPLDRLNTAQPELAPAVSPDGRWLYYRSGDRLLRRELAPLLEEARSR